MSETELPPKLKAEFEALLEDYTKKTNEMKDIECYETAPPDIPFGTPPPFESPVLMTVKNIRYHAYAMADLNPLYIDPEYAAKSRYGCIIAPPTILTCVRYPSGHGALVFEGARTSYPFATFFSGTAFEWFDVIRIGTRFNTSMKLKEFFWKKGASGRLAFLFYETFYWNSHEDLLAKAYGTMIESPRQAAFAVMKGLPAEAVTEKPIYDRGIYRYSDQEIEKLVTEIEKAEVRRGAEPLYWEDVNVGDKINTMVRPTFSVQDIAEFYIENRDAFERAYRRIKKEGSDITRSTHPITKWPYGGAGSGSHEDAILAVGPGAMSGPYDYGAQRVCFPEKMLTNWMGDHGFIRSLYLQTRNPVFYSESTFYTGQVVDKIKVKENGEEGGVPGEVEYTAVDIRIYGISHYGIESSPATARVYLPSRKLGEVKLPIPHPKTPPYIPFGQYIPRISLKPPTK